MRNGRYLQAPFRVGIAIGLLALMGCVPAAAVSAPVILISIDGMRPDAVTQADAHGLVVANLRRFVSEGAYADGVIGVYPTLTLPSHTTIVTGVDPAVHGILDNQIFNPAHPREGEAEVNFWGRDIRVETLWQAATAAGLTTASIHWPVTVDAPGITYDVPLYNSSIVTHGDLRLMEAISRPDGFLADLEAKVGPYTPQDVADWDQLCEQYAVQILRDRHPGLLAVHFGGLDDIQHKVGVFRPEGAKVLEKLDGFVGQLLQAGRDADPSTVFVVVSDHGHADVRWDVNLTSAFADAGLITLSPPDKTGHRRVLDGQLSVEDGASAAIYLKDPSNASVRDRTRAVLRRLQGPRFGIIDRILEGDAARATGGFPGATFVINYRQGFEGGSDRAPLLTRHARGSSHGYFPDVPEMHASLFILGPNLPIHGDLGIVNMKQIAPSIADLLGIHFAAGGPSLIRRGGVADSAPGS